MRQLLLLLLGLTLLIIINLLTVSKAAIIRGMFGKVFASMYTGSLVGKGATVFAVWGYVIANTRPDKGVGGQVELNADLLAAILGSPKQEIEAAIQVLCSPDPKSRTKDKGGRRLIPLGEYDYQVVNFERYRKIRNEEERREQNREAQERYRVKLKKGKPLPGEKDYETAVRNGNEAEATHLLNNQPGLRG